MPTDKNAIENSLIPTRKEAFDEINKLQDEYVHKLIDMIQSPKYSYMKVLNFTSATGTGKTKMMAKLINAMPDYFFIVTTLSRGQLNQQVKTSLECDCDNSQFVVYGLMDYTVNSRITADDILNQIPKEKQCIWLRDEGHVKTNRYAELLIDRCYKIVNFSATNMHSDIKCNFTQTMMLRTVNQACGTPEDAILKLLEVKQMHQCVNGYNPCAIFRCMSEKKDFIHQQIVELCEQYGLKYIDLNDDDYIMADLCRDDNEYDVIINKLKLTEGVDIRRAHVLYMDSQPQNDMTTIQAIGRCRRNALLYRDDIDILAPENKKLLENTRECFVFYNVDNMKIGTDEYGELSYAMSDHISVEQLKLGANISVINGQLANGYYVIELAGETGTFRIEKDVDTGFNVITPNTQFYDYKEKQCDNKQYIFHIYNYNHKKCAYEWSVEQAKKIQAAQSNDEYANYKAQISSIECKAEMICGEKMSYDKLCEFRKKYEYYNSKKQHYEFLVQNMPVWNDATEFNGKLSDSEIALMQRPDIARENEINNYRQQYVYISKTIKIDILQLQPFLKHLSNMVPDNSEIVNCNCNGISIWIWMYVCKYTRRSESLGILSDNEYNECLNRGYSFCSKATHITMDSCINIEHTSKDEQALIDSGKLIITTNFSFNGISRLKKYIKRLISKNVNVVELHRTLADLDETIKEYINGKQALVIFMPSCKDFTSLYKYVVKDSCYFYIVEKLKNLSLSPNHISSNISELKNSIDKIESIAKSQRAYIQVFNDKESAIIGTDTVKFVRDDDGTQKWIEDKAITSKVKRYDKLNVFISNKYQSELATAKKECFHNKNNFNISSKCASMLGYCVEYYSKYLVYGSVYLGQYIDEAQAEASKAVSKDTCTIDKSNETNVIIIRACMMKYRAEIADAFGYGATKLIPTMSVIKLAQQNCSEFISLVTRFGERTAHFVMKTLYAEKTPTFYINPNLSVEHISGVADYITYNTILDIKVCNEINERYLKQVLAYHYLTTKRSDLQITSVIVYDAVSDRAITIDISPENIAKWQNNDCSRHDLESV